MSILATFAAPVSGQILDRTMVPSGLVRFQANGVFAGWDSRFGRLPDGSSPREDLGTDLTDPSALSLFPGIPTLAQSLSSLTGTANYSPVLGSVTGRVTQDVTRVDFGMHIGVTDWLTVGGVLPWMRTRTAVDHLFVPDSVNGDLGISPNITNAPGVSAFLAAASSADAEARARADAECALGAGAACTSAGSLATRTAAFDSFLRTAYGASPFFPIAGSAMGDALSSTTSTLDADLIAAGLSGISAPLSLATTWLTSDGLTGLPASAGSGIETTPLTSRKSLWAAGDVELSARAIVLDNLDPEAGNDAPAFGYRVMADFVVRLPTGTGADPDVLFDVGTGDAQMDMEGGLTTFVTLGTRLGLGVGGRYGSQGSTTVIRRVAAPEVVMPAASTRASLTWTPGSYIGLDAAPTLRLTPELSITGEYRFFQKRRDEYALTMANTALDPFLLETESGVTLHQIAVGFRYDTVASWIKGEAPRPLELHLRMVRSMSGGGGQTPVESRVEAGLRLFKRFWG